MFFNNLSMFANKVILICNKKRMSNIHNQIPNITPLAFLNRLYQMQPVFNIGYNVYTEYSPHAAFAQRFFQIGL